MSLAADLARSLPPDAPLAFAMQQLPQQSSGSLLYELQKHGLSPGQALRSKHLPQLLGPDNLAALRSLTDPDSPLSKQLAGQWQKLRELGAQCLCLGDDGYPELLARIDDPPPLLYVQGDPACLERPALGVVGSRDMSTLGGHNARRMASELGGGGLAIVSGLAQGIDREAHLGALQAGACTVAVMGTGIDLIYPARNRSLASDIVAAGGALVTEFPLGAPPLPYHFPQRNRIISGLCLGVLVVEASDRSGSLISARLAGDQGREVMAMPGATNNKRARGCNQLIRDGATLVENSGHVVEQLGPALGHLAFAERTREADLSDAERRILDSLGDEPCAIDDLVAQTGMEVDEVSGILLGLERQELVAQTAGSYQRLDA